MEVISHHIEKKPEKSPAATCFWSI